MLTLLFALVFSTPVAALAQEGTPSAGGGGEAVTIYGPDAQPVGTVSVDEVIDPFEDFDSGSQPARGYRWVMAVVTITAGERALSPNSSGFSALDSEGFLAYQSYVYRTSEQSAELPDMTGDEIPAGQSRTGAVFFAIFMGMEIASIEYSLNSDMSIPVYQPSGSQVAAGDVISISANDGSPMLEITVDGVIDPLEDYDSSYAPQRGFYYTAVVVTITNSGSRVYQTSPYNFTVVDHEGFISNAAGVYRTSEGTAMLPDLPYQDLEPGASVTGLVSFQLVSGAQMASVIFQPTYDRRVRIAEFEAGQPFPEFDMASLPTAVPADPVCEAVYAWGDSIEAITGAISDPVELVEAQDMASGSVDVEALQSGADELRSIAQQIAGLDTPEAAVAAQEQFIGVLLGMALDMEKMIEASAAGDQAAFDAAKADVTVLLMGFIGDGPFTELSERCPDM
jgi:hypothetical protein